MTPDLFVALVVLALVYCAGGLHGLLLAWSQEARMWRYAGKVHRVSMRLVEGLEAAETRHREGRPS